jgi:hypothetical protein
VYLHVRNGGASPITVTVETPRTDPLGNAVADNEIDIDDGDEAFIGP